MANLLAYHAESLQHKLPDKDGSKSLFWVDPILTPNERAVAHFRAAANLQTFFFRLLHMRLQQEKTGTITIAVPMTLVCPSLFHDTKLNMKDVRAVFGYKERVDHIRKPWEYLRVMCVRHNLQLLILDDERGSAQSFFDLLSKGDTDKARVKAMRAWVPSLIIPHKAQQGKPVKSGPWCAINPKKPAAIIAAGGYYIRKD